MKKSKLLFAFTLLGFSGLSCVTALAEGDAPVSSGVPAITWSASFDFYYGYNFNRPQEPALNLGAATTAGTTPQFLSASQNGAYRNFDIYHNQLAMSLAEISVAKKGKEVSFKADFDFGENADLMANSSGAAANGSVDQISKHIGQAVLTYNPSHFSNLTINLGKMYTHMGLETAKARDNWQYSRSILFSAGVPYWHAGANVAYAWVPNRFTTGFYLYNGWNNLVDNNPGKTFGFQAAINPTDSIAIYYNLITGAEGVNNSDYRTVHDLNATYTVSPELAFSMDGIYGTSTANGNVNWKAIQFSSKHVFGPHYYLSPRLEGYWDPKGFTTGTAQSLMEVTLTNGVPVAEGLETRLELRWDRSDQRSFGLSSSGGPSKTQVTAVLGVLYTL